MVYLTLAFFLILSLPVLRPLLQHFKLDKLSQPWG